MTKFEDLPASPLERSGWPWTEGTSVPTEIGRFPALSVVTPSYNQAPFLEETIRSVLLQGYPNLEYGVMDGGSTDGSVEIIRKYAPFLSFWESRPDKGQTDAINKGLTKCTGSILAYLNSDDVYEPGALHAVARAFTDEDAEIIYGSYSQINRDSAMGACIKAPPFDPLRLLLDNFIAQPSTFWSSTVRKKLGDFDVRLHYSMDYDYWMRACAEGFRFKHMEQCLSRFRVHSNSKTVVQAARFWDDILLSLHMLLERGALPEAMRAMMPRAICRAHCRAATACFEGGDMSVARRHVEMAIKNASDQPHDEELEIAFQLCAMASGAVAEPQEFRRRKKELGIQRGTFSRAWREGLNREYCERLASHSCSRMVRALMDDPRRLLNWGFRRALTAAFKPAFM